MYLGTSSAPRFYFDPKPKDEVLYKFTCLNAHDSLNRALDTARNYAEIEWKEMEGDTLDPSIQTVKIMGKAKNAFPDDSLVVIYNKPVLDSLKDMFFIVENKDTTQVSVHKLDPIRYVVKRSERWPTDSKIKLEKYCTKGSSLYPCFLLPRRPSKKEEALRASTAASSILSWSKKFIAR